MTIDLFSIGGGDLGAKATLALDRLFVEGTGKAHPRVVFVPTASDDSPDYVAEFEKIYGEAIGCKTESLLLWGRDSDPARAAEMLRSADAVYVGGGNTKKMLELWRSMGLDKVFAELAGNGIPLGGLSAGAICWYRLANSDWPQYEGVPGVNTAPLEGLGFVDMAVCPHTRDEGFRMAEFREMMRTVAGPGVGIDDACALHVVGDKYRILACEEGAVAHLIQWVDGELFETELEPDPDFRPLADLHQV